MTTSVATVELVPDPLRSSKYTVSFPWGNGVALDRPAEIHHMLAEGHRLCVVLAEAAETLGYDGRMRFAPRNALGRLCVDVTEVGRAPLQREEVRSLVERWVAT